MAAIIGDAHGGRQANNGTGTRAANPGENVISGITSARGPSQMA
jgi:hypothetical protein